MVPFNVYKQNFNNHFSVDIMRVLLKAIGSKPKHVCVDRPKPMSIGVKYKVKILIYDFRMIIDELKSLRFVSDYKIKQAKGHVGNIRTLHTSQVWVPKGTVPSTQVIREST